MASVRQLAPGGEILLVWGDDKNRRALFKILSATGAQVRFIDEPERAAEFASDSRLVVMDYDSVGSAARRALTELAALKTPPPVLVITAGGDKEQLVELLANTALTNLFVKNIDVLATELIVTVQKIVHGELFGLEKYLTWGIQPVEHKVTGSRMRRQVIEELEAYLGSLGANKRLVGHARDVADELLMNAIYDAPVDEHGKPKYAAMSRSEAVDLLPSEAVVFRYACDGRQLALSVSDSFGVLERQTVLGYLRRCFLQGEDQIEMKKGGAGLGLYYSFQSLNHFIIIVAPNRRTEMIGLLDISGSFRDFAQQAKSLHLFIDRSA